MSEEQNMSTLLVMLGHHHLFENSIAHDFVKHIATSYHQGLIDTISPCYNG